MEHKLIMENWRKYVKESAASTVLGIASGTKDVVGIDDVDDIAVELVSYLAGAFGYVSKKLVAGAPPPTSLLPGTSAVNAMGGGLRKARKLRTALANAGLLGKFNILLKNATWAKMLMQKVGTLAVTKGLARVLPPVAIALEIYDIVNLWNEETKGVNTWGLALDAVNQTFFDVPHPGIATDLSPEKRAERDRERPTTDNFDKWDEETQVGWCVRNYLKNAPDDFEGTLTCKAVIKKADPKLIQRAKPGPEFYFVYGRRSDDEADPTDNKFAKSGRSSK